MGDLELTPKQITYAVAIGKKLKASGSVLLSYDEFGLHFGVTQAQQLRFVLSTNAWKIALDDVLQLVAVTHQAGGTATWPIEDLMKQVLSMQRRRVWEEGKRG